MYSFKCHNKILRQKTTLYKGWKFSEMSAQVTLHWASKSTGKFAYSENSLEMGHSQY